MVEEYIDLVFMSSAVHVDEDGTFVFLFILVHQSVDSIAPLL